MGRGRPQKAALTCKHNKDKKARCNCPGSTICKKCCDICSGRSIPVVTPMKTKVGNRKASHEAMISISNQMKDLNLTDDRRDEVSMPMLRRDETKRGIKDVLQYIGETDNFLYSTRLYNNSNHNISRFVKAFVHAIVHIVHWLITSTFVDAGVQSEIQDMVIERLIKTTENIDRTHTEDENKHRHQYFSINNFREIYLI